MVACSPDKPEGQSELETTTVAPLNLNRSYNKDEIKFACTSGCQYHYKIYLNANKIVKDAVSLKNASLESIQKECERACQLDVFYKLNQAGINKEVEETPVADDVVVPNEEQPVEAPTPNPNKEFKSLEDL